MTILKSFIASKLQATARLAIILLLVRVNLFILDVVMLIMSSVRWEKILWFVYTVWVIDLTNLLII